MDRKIKAGITGASGYAGIELVRILARHPSVELACVTSRSLAGTLVADNMPSLRHLLPADMKFLPSDPAEQAKMDTTSGFSRFRTEPPPNTQSRLSRLARP